MSKGKKSGTIEEKQKKQTEEANQQSENPDSLISSDVFPSIEDMENQYLEEMKAFSEEMNKEKKKGKKSSKEIASDQQPIPEDERIDPALIEDLVCFPWDIFLKKSEESLSDIERKAWSKACAKVIDKYKNAFTAKYQEEIGLCICLTTIVITHREAFRKKEDTTPPELPRLSDKEAQERQHG